MDLNDIMEFGHLVKVLSDGSVVDGPEDLWAPDFRNDELFGCWRNGTQDRWKQFSSGYTGQYGTATPMHNSEFIGGRLAQDILAAPGIYVAVVCHWDCDCEPEDLDEYGECNEDHDEGWCVARYEGEDYS